MRGKMWVDEQAYQWVKVEAEVFRPVAFGLFIAKVEPGTEFTLEQKPVQENLWLPSHFSVSVKARILQYWSHNTTDDETYSHYTRASQAAEPGLGLVRCRNLLPCIVSPLTIGSESSLPVGQPKREY
jgi:hypothetical protein